MYLLLLTVCLSAVALGQIPSLGFCPEYVPVSDFDMSRFLGKWYEAERYFTVSEVASRCVTTDYTRGPSGKIYVSNEITNRLTSIKRVINGVLDFSGKAGEGSLSVKYNSFPPYDTNYKILDTDYENYFVMWSCSGIGPVHTQNAWVYTRSRNPSVATLQRAYGVLDKFKISRTFFLKTDQKDCALGGAIEESAATSTSTTSKPTEDTDTKQEIESKSLDQDPLKPIEVAEHILKNVEPVVKPYETVAVQDTEQFPVQDIVQEIPVEILKDDVPALLENAEKITSEDNNEKKLSSEEKIDEEKNDISS